MFHDAHRDEPARDRRGLLAQLPARGVLGALPVLDLPARELPEPPEEAPAGSALDEPSPSVLEDDDRGPPVRSRAPAPRAWDRSGIGKLGPGAARAGDGAASAAGGPGKADGLAQLHQRLVELSGTVPRQLLPQAVLELPAAPRGRASRGEEVPPGDDPEAVRLERGDGDPEREARHRGRGVGAEAGQFRELLRTGGEAASEPNDLARGLVQAVGAGVVAGPFPELQDLLALGRRERGKVRKPRDEPLVVRDRLLHPRLLEEHLRDPDAVGVPVVPPRERSTVGPVPAEERAGAGGPGPGRW